MITMENRFDGKKLALQMTANIAEEVNSALSKGVRPPKLAIVMIGDNKASEKYVKLKQKKALEIGMISEVFAYEGGQLAQAQRQIEMLNVDHEVDGVMVQLPLPERAATQELVDLISTQKDVDGLTSHNLGLIALGGQGFLPATVRAVVAVLDAERYEVKGKDIVIVNNSNLIGLPLALYLSRLGATVQICHEYTENLDSKCLQADVIVSATGVKHLIKREMVREGALVIDAGIDVAEDGSVAGDLSPKAYAKAGLYTPVPGGVGPLTVASLLVNTFESYKRTML